MGVYLSKPLTAKDSDMNESDILAACSTDMQGWRLYMEDAHIMYLDTSKEVKDLALFGVFDGHGGPAVARWVSMKFIEVFKNLLDASELKLARNELEFKVPPENLPATRIAAVAETLLSSFLTIDEQLFLREGSLERELRVIQAAAMRLRKREMSRHGIEEPCTQLFFKDLLEGKRCPSTDRRVTDDSDNVEKVEDDGMSFKDLFDDEFSKDHSKNMTENFNSTTSYQEKRQAFDPQSCGCTAVVASILIAPEPILVVANAGDSRCVLSRGGVAKPMTVDHKPMQEREMDRITNAGGAVQNGRVDGNLNLSRSLGDLHYKKNTQLPPEKQKISAVPDITYIRLCPKDDFVILACDGIWDILTEQTCVDQVRSNWDELVAENQQSGTERTDADMCRLISQKLCDTCLAPTPFDPENAGAGCDNMTAMVIRVKDSWRAQFADNEACDSEVKLYGTTADQLDYLKTEIGFK